MTTPAGWYDDPSTPGGQRWWDGEQWTEHVVAPTEAVDAVPDGETGAVATPTPESEPTSEDPVLDPTMPFDAPAAPGPPPGLVSGDDVEATGAPAPARSGRILLAVAGVIVLVAAAAAALLFLGDDEGTVTPETVPVEETSAPTQVSSTSTPPPTESTTTTEQTTSPARTPEAEAARSALLDVLTSEPSALTEPQALCVVDGLETAGLPFAIDQADATEDDVELITELIFGCVADN